MAGAAALLRPVVERVQELGVSPARVLDAAGLDAGRLGRADPGITHEQYDTVIERAMGVDEALGLHVGQSIRPETLTGYLVMLAPTLRGAFDDIRRCRVLEHGPSFDLLERERAAQITFEIGSASLRCRRFQAEYTMTAFSRMVRFFGRGAPPTQVEFEHPAPSYAAEYQRIFQGTVRFGQARTSLSFERELLDWPQVHAHDMEVYAMLQREALRRLGRLTRVAYSERVHDFMLERGASGCSDMSAAAAAMGISVRSLRRRLNDEGVSYNALVDEARATLAQSLLRDEDRTLADTAEALGYSDQRAFCRAFKRWTGKTPTQYRAQRAS